MFLLSFRKRKYNSSREQRAAGTISAMDETVVVHEERLSPRGYEISLRAHRAHRTVYYVLWVLEVFMGFRFLLKLLGANPSNIFAELVYGVTWLLMLPFTTLFFRAAPVVEGAAVTRTFELSVLVAMLVYAVIAWGVARFIILASSKPHERS